MAELDLPPISFARYVDLLKRRRWQVLPITVLGLVIGALVALMIPRYYVAQTVVRFNGRLLKNLDRNQQDPLLPAISVARTMVGVRVAEALERLRWPEHAGGTPAERRAVEADVRSRVELHDVGQAEKNRTVTLIRIAYRDTNGVRAAELCNAVREVWLQGEHQQLEAELQGEVALRLEASGQALRQLQSLRTELANFERQHAINPQDWVGGRDRQSELSRQLDETGRRLSELRAQVTTLQGTITLLEQELASQAVPRRIPVPMAEQTANPEVAARLAQAIALRTMAQRGLESTTPSHLNHAIYPRALAMADAELRAAQASMTAAAPRERDNPEYLSRVERLDRCQGELVQRQAELAQQEIRQRELRQLVEALPEVKRSYEDLIGRRDAAESSWKDLERRSQEAQEEKRVSLNEKLIEVLEEAREPQRPTEPNVVLVAGTGSVLGLGLAIVLILLLDFVRSTFKTIDDVERSLPVPVLGSLAHLETEEQRRQVAHRRARASLLAGAFLVMLCALVTVYYVAPSRLPVPIWKALQLLLGAGE